MKMTWRFVAALVMIASGALSVTWAQAPVPFLSGGIGVAEQEALRTRESEFNLKLVFTLVEGNYIADVRVNVRDARGGVVLDRLAGGPFFLARLPAGTYTIDATYRDKTVSRTVTVGERLRTEYLRWPSDPATDFPLPAEEKR